MLSARVPHVCIAFYIVCEKYHFFCPDLDEGPHVSETPGPTVYLQKKLCNNNTHIQSRGLGRK